MMPLGRPDLQEKPMTKDYRRKLCDLNNVVEAAGITIGQTYTYTTTVPAPLVIPAGTKSGGCGDNGPYSRMVDDDGAAVVLNGVAD